jgi:hypothetical protein
LVFLLSLIVIVVGISIIICCYCCHLTPNQNECFGIFFNEPAHAEWNLSENLKNFSFSIFGAAVWNAIIRTLVHWLTLNFVYADQSHMWPTSPLSWFVDIVFFLLVFIGSGFISIAVLIYALAQCPLIFTVSITVVLML